MGAGSPLIREGQRTEAMFPLGTVLLPTAFLPLNVFESRYRTMLVDLLEGSRRFGVVLIERGSERIAYAGDLIPTSFHLHPAWISASDEFPNETLTQKRQLIEMAMEGGWLIIFGHGNDCRSGYVSDRNGKPQFIPIEV